MNFNLLNCWTNSWVDASVTSGIWILVAVLLLVLLGFLGLMISRKLHGFLPDVM